MCTGEKTSEFRVLLTKLYEYVQYFPLIRGSKNFIRGGPTLTTFFFLVDEGWEDPNTTICGPISARQRNAILMAFRWRADDGPTLNAGLVALCFSGDPDQFCYETLYFCDFSGGGGPDLLPPPPSGSAHISKYKEANTIS